MAHDLASIRAELERRLRVIAMGGQLWDRPWIEGDQMLDCFRYAMGVRRAAGMNGLDALRDILYNDTEDGKGGLYSLLPQRIIPTADRDYVHPEYRGDGYDRIGPLGEGIHRLSEHGVIVAVACGAVKLIAIDPAVERDRAVLVEVYRDERNDICMSMIDDPLNFDPGDIRPLELSAHGTRRLDIEDDRPAPGRNWVEMNQAPRGRRREGKYTFKVGSKKI